MNSTDVILLEGGTGPERRERGGGVWSGRCGGPGGEGRVGECTRGEAGGVGAERVGEIAVSESDVVEAVPDA